jgi:prophage maintenance system killer protein
MANNYDISATEDEKYLLVINVASGEKRHEEIVEWLKKHCTEKNSR